MIDYDALVPSAPAATPAAPAAGNDIVDNIGAPPAPAQTPTPLVDDDTPPLPADKFGQLVEDVTQDHVDMAQAANAGMQGTNADKAAKAIDIGKQLDMNPAAVIPNLESLSSQAQLIKNNKILQDNPSLAAWVVDQPIAANAAKDDFDKLDTLSKISVTLAEAAQPIAANRLYRAGATLQAENLVGADNSNTLANIQGLKSDADSYNLYQPTGAYGKVSWGINQAVGLVDNFVHSLPAVGGGAVVGAIAGLPEGGVGAIPGAITGAGVGLKVGLATDWARTSAGQTYLALNDLRDNNGKPMSEAAKQTAAGTVGALTFGIGLIGAPAQGAVAKEALQSLTGDAVKEALVRPSVVSAVTSIAKNTAIGATQGASIMGAMAIAQQVGQEVGKQISPGDWNTVVNDPTTRAAYVSQLADAIESGAIAFGAMHGVAGAIGEYGNYRQSTVMQQNFSDLMQSSEQSKTRARSPDAFQTFMQSQLNGTAAENVYAPASKIQELYTKSNTVPGPDDGLFGKAVPDIAKQLQQSADINGDVVIPSDAYAAHIAGTPMDKALRNDIRLTQDGMSVNEANDFNAKYQDILSQVGSKLQDQQEEPHNKIYQDMLQKTQDAGINDAQGAQYAAVTAARYATRGARLDLDPLELYHEQGIQVRRGEEGETPDAALNAFPAKAPGNEVTLDDLEKNARDQVKGENRPVSELLDYLKGDTLLPKDQQPVSLSAFLRKNGGINNEGGEFDAASVNKSAKGLIKEKGMNHDDAAQKAWEAGYIGKPDERPDIEEFRAAVRRDVAKKDVFSQADDLLDKGKRAQATDIDELLHQHSIPIEGRDNADIIKDMQDAGIITGHPADEFKQTSTLKLARKTVRENVLKRFGKEITEEDGKYKYERRTYSSREGAESALIQDKSQIVAKEMGLEIRSPEEIVSYNKSIIERELREVERRAPFMEEARRFAEENDESDLESIHNYADTLADDHDQQVEENERDAARETAKQFLEDTVENLATALGQKGKGSGLSGSHYFEDAGLRIRVSDHQLPPTYERMHGSPDIEIAVGNIWPDADYFVQDAEQAKTVISTVKSKVEEARKNNPDEFEQDARAKVTIGEGQHIITLFKSADKSAMLHEMGHIWLTELQKDAERDDAPEQLKKDWETVKTYIGHDSGDIQEESHETFARSFEAYLMDGKAPSNSLRAAFRRFKQWLTSIYRSVSNLNVDVSPEIKQVFDRMLATDEEISQMEQRNSANQLFRTKDEAGMTDAEFAAYNKKALNAQDAAREQLLTEAMEEVKKQHGVEWRKAAEEIKPEVAEAIRNRPDIRAIEWFKTGKLRDGQGGEIEISPMPIDKKALDQMSPGASKEMPRGVPLVEEGGAHPDEIAPVLGYDSGMHMISDLRELAKSEKEGGRRQVQNYLTDQEIDSRLQHRFGVSDDELNQRAEDLMGNPDRLDLKLAELRALGRKTGQPVMFTKENIGKWADDRISTMNAKDAANSYQFVRAAAKAGREAIRAVAGGKDAEAMEALQKQALHMALADRARDFQKDYASGNKLFKYVTSKPVIKSVAQDYLNNVHALLNKFGFKVNRNPQELNNSLAGKSLQDFILDKTGIGREIYSGDYLFEPSVPEYKRLTVDQFHDLHNTVQSLIHNGREEQSIVVDGRRVEKDRIITEILDNIATFKDRPQSEFLNSSDAGFLQRNLDKFTSVLRASDAELLKPEQMMDWLDKREVLGPLNKYVFKPMKDAQNLENDLLVEQSKAFRDLKVDDKWSKSLKDEIPNSTLIDPDTGNPARMSRKTMLSIALNSGNDSNLTKLAEGYGWQKSDVQEFLQKNMTKSDWDFTQHTWDSFEKLWPKIEALQRRTTGIAPTKIDATPITTAHGEYRGGYYPVVYDAEKTQVGARNRAADSIFDNDYYRPTTAKGHTISRLNDYSAKIQLSLDVLPWKLRQAVHDLAFREAIVNADKILSDTRFTEALKKTWGAEYGKEFRPWLKDIANQPNADNRPASFLDNALRYSRMTMVEVGIGFRLTTMAKHGLTALSNSVGEIGPDSMRRGVQEYYSDRGGKQQFVMDRSGEMRHRMAQYDRDIRENLGTLLGESSIIQSMRHFGHYGVAFFDMESAMPTWIGAYRKALAEGMEDKDASYAADKTVRNAHGAQGQVDLAGVQRGPEYKKLFTMFYGFFNHMYNRERDIAHRALNDGDYAQVLARSLTYIAIPALVEQAISGPSVSKDEGWGKWAAKAVVSQMAATLPLVRDVAGYLERGKGPETPLSRTITAIGEQVKDIDHAAEGEKVSKKWVRHMIEMPGYLLGLPTGQGAVTAQYLWDVSNGKEDPKDVQQWLHGMMYGTSVKK